MDKHENAINYVIQLIKSLDPTAEVEVAQPRPYQYNFFIDIKGQQVGIIFNRSTMDDFEYEITKNKGTDRYYASEGFIKFQVYEALGQVGTISHFNVSDELLNKNRDWLKKYSTRFEKPAWLYEIFYQGLKKLSNFLTELVIQYKTVPEEIKNEQNDIIGLIEWYDKHHHFTENSISETSLGYFKAAAVCVILDKEQERKSIKIPRILKAKDQEIYAIVSELRKNSFPQIKMPDCIYDYASHIRSLKGNQETVGSLSSNVSCGPLAKDMCDLKASIESEFSEKNIFLDIPYRSYEDCEGALRDIFSIFGLQPIVAKDRLTSNAVLCKVCRLIKTCKYGIADISSGSNSVSYEYGLMHGFGMKVCLLLRSASDKFTDIHGLEHVPYNGLRKFRIEVAKWLLDNIAEITRDKVEEFIRTEELALKDKGEISLRQIATGIEEVPQFEVILNEDRKGFGSSTGGEKNTFHDIGYHLSFRIRNKSTINICLEEIEAKNILLGTGKLDRTNPRLSKLPFNIEPHKTEELNLMIKFPNEVDLSKKDEDLKIEINFKFSDQTIAKEVIGYFQ